MTRSIRGQIVVFVLATSLVLPFGAPDAASAAPRHGGRHYAGRHYGGNAGAAAAAGIVGGVVAGAVAAGVAAGGQPYYGGPYAAPNCWMENRSAWNGYQWIVQPVQVCPW